MSRACSVEGCERKHLARGFCCMHYNRWLEYSDPMYVMYNKDGHKKNNQEMYKIYMGLKDRCLNQNSRYYHNYGGRGIEICDRWLGPNGFMNFLEDMGKRPEGVTSNGRALYSLDRIDVDGDYSPNNCRWATWEEQENNRRCNVKFKHDGKELSLRQWSRELGISYSTLCYRLYKKKLSPPELFNPIDIRYSRPQH